MTPVPIQPMRVFKEITGGFFLLETAMFLSLQVLCFEVNSIWAQGAGHRSARHISNLEFRNPQFRNPKSPPHACFSWLLTPRSLVVHFSHHKGTKPPRLNKQKTSHHSSNLLS
jgi:hypothetical protein